VFTLYSYSFPNRWLGDHHRSTSIFATTVFVKINSIQLTTSSSKIGRGKRAREGEGKMR
jgi:hypothetical protein